MIQPVLQDDEFLADVFAARDYPNDLHLWWLGQSGFLAQWQGRHLLFDPYLSDSLTSKYAATDKPHVPITERVIAPERIKFFDLITSNHNHTDHLDQETAIPFLAAHRLGAVANQWRPAGAARGRESRWAPSLFAGQGRRRKARHSVPFRDVRVQLGVAGVFRRHCDAVGTAVQGPASG